MTSRTLLIKCWLTTILEALFLSAFAAGGAAQSDLSGLRGSVEIVRVERARYWLSESGSWSKAQPILVAKVQYNSEGLITNEVIFDSDGSIKLATEFKYEFGKLVEESRTCDSSYGCSLMGSKTTYSYNDEGSIIEEKVFFDDGSSPKRTIYEYDENGLLLNEFIYYGSSEFRAVMYTYDLNSRLAEKHIYLFPGEEETGSHEVRTLIRKTTYSYDENGRLVIEQDDWYTLTGLQSMRRIVETQYNSTGLKSEHTSLYGEDGKISERSVKTYDAEGRQVGHVRIHADGFEVTMSTYNAEGTLIEESMSGLGHDGRPFKTLKRYNFAGDITQELFYNADGTVYGSSHRYEYDSMGNWVTREAYDPYPDGTVPRTLQVSREFARASSVTYRTISYHSQPH